MTLFHCFKPNLSCIFAIGVHFMPVKMIDKFCELLNWKKMGFLMAKLEQSSHAY